MPVGLAPVSAQAKRPGSAMFGTVGAAMEWYDFTLYVYLAPVISQLFFPAADPLDSLLATFGVFATGYVVRPLGAAVLGNIGDTRGRKVALGLSIALMAAAMLVIALLPTESTIGVAAPIALIVLRLIQGFSLGGEFSGSIVLLQESAAPERRGFITNLVQISTGAGVLLSAGSVALLHAVFTDAQMADFGWRIPFLGGAAIGVVALALLRTRVVESTEFEPEGPAPPEVPLKTLLRDERRPLALNFLLNGHQSLIYYVVATFVPTFVTSILGGPPEEALLASAVSALTFMVLCPPAGAWSDRVGRRPLLAAAAIAMAVTGLPLFLLISEVTFLAVLAGQLALMTLVVVFTSPALVTATELFPARTRYSGVAVGYNLGAAVFGGTAPLLATALIKVTGYDQAPGLLLAAASLLVLIVIAKTPETAPARIDRQGDRQWS